MTSPSISPEITTGASAGTHQESLEAVSAIFGSSAAALYVEPMSDCIPQRLRWVRGSPQGKWQPPWQVIGIQCGPASQGLCAVIFRSEAGLRTFIKANPGLRETLITCWPEAHYVLWLQPTDFMPGNVDADTLSWISQGVIPVAIPGSPAKHLVLRDRRIVSVQLASLKWPAEMQEYFEVLELQHAFGPKYRRLGVRKVVLNLTFWAHFLVRKLGLVYHVQRRTFLWTQSTAGRLEKLELPDLIKLTASALQQAATLDAPRFPVSEMRLQRIKALIEEMKVAAAAVSTGDRDVVLEFLGAEVQAKKGTDLTVAELRERYVERCRQMDQPVCPESVFQRLLAVCIKDRFGVVKSHDLRRTGPDGAVHWHRGFHNLAFKEEARPDVPDGPDVNKSESIQMAGDTR